MMVEQLLAIIARRTLPAPDFSQISQRFGGSWRADKPARQLEFVIALCTLAVPCLGMGGDSVQGDGADSLVRFIADMPDWLVRAVSDVPEFRDDIKRAWDEPCADPYISLCNTVNDVWAHLLGPESSEDALILQALRCQKGQRILDYGAGAGHFAVSLASNGNKVDAFDVDAVKCAFLRYRIERQGLASQLRVGVIDGPYDVGLAINVFDHLLDPSAAVELIAANTRPGGLFVMLATFPDDGWHQADPQIVIRCASAVQHHFQPSLARSTSLPWLEIYLRHRTGAEQTEHEAYPCMHPKSTLSEGNRDGEIVLSARACFTQDCVLDGPTSALCEHLTGAATVHSIAEAFEIGLPELMDFCSFLRDRGHLFWLDTDLQELDRYRVTGEDHGRRLA